MSFTHWTGPNPGSWKYHKSHRSILQSPLGPLLSEDTQTVFKANKLKGNPNHSS
jgi:hypothetical protein